MRINFLESKLKFLLCFLWKEEKDFTTYLFLLNCKKIFDNRIFYFYFNNNSKK